MPTTSSLIDAGGPMYTMREPVRRAEHLFGEHQAVVYGATGRTYAELAERVRRVAGLLETITEPGDRVAVWALNSDRYLELFIGVPCAGRVIVPHNTRWAEPELLASTTDAGAVVLICDRDPGALARVVDHVIRLDTGEYDERLAAAAQCEPAIFPETLAGLFYTGGTTGTSKGVMLTHANLMANAVHTQLSQPLLADDRYLTMAPMFHAAGVYTALVLPWVGATNVIVAGFDPDIVLDVIAGEAITCAIAVPTMLAALVERQQTDPRDVSSLRWLSHGAAPVAVDVLRRAAALFDCELIHSYGSTELSPLATVFRHEERHLDGPRAKSCGQPMPGVDLDIVDGDGRPVPEGVVGEVVVRGPNVMVGYWNKPDQTEAAMLDGGWYRTGDLGRVDQDGYLFLVDRAKDMIVTGGVHAVVVLRADATVTERSLVDHCRRLIASYKIPKSITFQTEPLPKSGPGKVLKRTLRAAYWEGRTGQIN